MARKPPKLRSPELSSWFKLNYTVMNTSDLELLELLLEEELSDRRREIFVMRLHGRIMRIKNTIERDKILARLGKL